MRNFNLYIAGYNIRFESSDDGPALVLSERILNFLCGENKPDITIKIHSGEFSIPAEAQKVFNAPYVEEVNGMRMKKNDRFWSVHKIESDIYISIVFPFSNEPGEAILKFSMDKKDWDLWIDSHKDKADPMEYPLDALILYYLTVIHHDIFIHASGVWSHGKGYIFSGISGRGKTTMAGLWKMAGSGIIHDDRLIIRKTGDSYMMYNTPVYQNEEPAGSKLDRIFIIEHGKENRITEPGIAEAVSLVMSNCIQHNWNRSIVSGLLDSVSGMITAVPVSRLYFLPEKSAVYHILEYERQKT